MVRQIKKKIKVRSDWRDVLKKAWSVRFMALAMFFTFLEVVLPFFVDGVPPKMFALLSGAAAVGGLVSRFVLQKGIK